MRRIIVLLSLLTALGTALPGGHGLRTAAAQTPPAALAPEEAVIALLPYLLTPTDIPAGYQLFSTGANSAASYAATAADPAADFAEEISSGFVVSTEQTLSPVVQDGSVPGVLFAIELYTDAAAARRYASGQSFPPAADATSTVDPVTLPATVGEASFAYHSTYSDTGQGSYTVRWQHGRLGLRVFTYAPAGKEQLDDALALVSAFEAKEAALPAPALGPPTVSAPATEAQRLDAALQLQSLSIDPAASPAGYTFNATTVVPAAAVVAAAGDPMRALHQVAEQWKRLMEIDQTFVSAQNSTVSLTTAAVLDVDAAGATADVNAYDAPPGGTVATLPAPAQLGDTTFLRRLTGSNSDGSSYEVLDLQWTHGAVLLDVYMTAAGGQTSADTVLALARQFEALYQASPFVAAQ